MATPSWRVHGWKRVTVLQTNRQIHMELKYNSIYKSKWQRARQGRYENIWNLQKLKFVIVLTLRLNSYLYNLIISSCCCAFIIITFLFHLPGILEEAEFYNITELIRLVKERIIQRDNRPPKASKKHMYRVLQCHENEVAQLVSTMSDGWKFEQVGCYMFLFCLF